MNQDDNNICVYVYNAFSKTSDDGLSFRHKDKNKGYYKSHAGRISKECWQLMMLASHIWFSKMQQKRTKKKKKQTIYSLQELVEEQFLWSTLFLQSLSTFTFKNIWISLLFSPMCQNGESSSTWDTRENTIKHLLNNT